MRGGGWVSGGLWWGQVKQGKGFAHVEFSTTSAVDRAFELLQVRTPPPPGPPPAAR
jgi:hypothetical protein